MSLSRTLTAMLLLVPALHSCGASKPETVHARSVPQTSDLSGTNPATTYSCISGFIGDKDLSHIDIIQCMDYTTAGPKALYDAQQQCESLVDLSKFQPWANAPCGKDNLIGFCAVTNTENGFFADRKNYYRIDGTSNDRTEGVEECANLQGTWTDLVTPRATKPTNPRQHQKFSPVLR